MNWDHVIEILCAVCAVGCYGLAEKQRINSRMWHKEAQRLWGKCAAGLKIMRELQGDIDQLMHLNRKSTESLVHYRDVLWPATDNSYRVEQKKRLRAEEALRKIASKDKPLTIEEARDVANSIVKKQKPTTETL